MNYLQNPAVGTFVGTELATAKLEWDARKEQIKDMFPEIYQALYGSVPSHQVVNGAIMSAKGVGAVKSFADMFKSDDAISVGLSSISNARPPKDMLFLVTHIQVLYAIAASLDDGDVAAADYNLIPTEMRNGTIEVMQNKRVIFDEQDMEQFNVADQYQPVGDTNANGGTPITYTMKGVGHVGIVKLASPKFIVPEEEIEVNLKFAKALNANAAVKVVFYGVRSIRV